MGWSKTFEDNYEDSFERFESSRYYEQIQNDTKKTEAVLITGQLLFYGNKSNNLKGAIR